MSALIPKKVVFPVFAPLGHFIQSPSLMEFWVCQGLLDLRMVDSAVLVACSLLLTLSVGSSFQGPLDRVSSCTLVVGRVRAPEGLQGGLFDPLKSTDQ